MPAIDVKAVSWPLIPACKLFLFLLGFASHVLADNQQPPAPTSEADSRSKKAEAEEAPDWGSYTSNWLINKRNSWGQKIGDAGQRLDGFFANTESELEQNGSFVKVGFSTKWSKGEQAEFDPTLRFRLDLPTLRKKLRFVIESDPDENAPLTESQRQVNTFSKTKVQEKATGAVQLKTSHKKKWSLSTSVGIEFNIPLNPFWRARYYQRWPLTEDWDLVGRQSIYYFHQDGWGEKTSLAFERNFNDALFRAKTEAKYLHDERKMEYAHTFSWLQELSDIRAITYRLGMLAENKPKVRATEYFINATYRRKLYEDWFFYEATPELAFPRDDKFEADPTLILGFEVVFSAPGQKP